MLDLFIILIPLLTFITFLNHALDLDDEILRPNENPNENMPYDLMKAWLQIDHETMTKDNLQKGQQVYSMKEKLGFLNRRQPSVDQFDMT